jgi:Golgi nucleoside diphosphatase
LKATAGLRLLPGNQSHEILEAVESRLRTVYEFPLAEKDPVTVIDGKDEGVYAWITANYLLDTIKELDQDENKNRKARSTYAVEHRRKSCSSRSLPNLIRRS